MVKPAKWMVVFVVVLLRSSSGAALQLTPVEDMTLDSVFSSGCPAWDPNLSVHPIGYALYGMPNRVNRAVVHFDLTSAGVPPGAQVTSAKLRFYVEVNPGFQFDLAARRVTETRWTEAGAGWNYCDCYTAVPWATPGGDVTQVDEAIVPISGIGYRVMSVDALAQAAIDDEDGQLHLMLAAVSEAGSQHWVTIGSREHPDGLMRPTLDIDWGPTEIPPSKDKHISSAFGDCSAVIGGNNSTMNLGLSLDKVTQVMRPLLHFDLPAHGVSPGAVVSDATLKMSVTSVIAASGSAVTFTANRMLDTGWSEATAGWVYSKCEGPTPTPWYNPYYTTINASGPVVITRDSTQVTVNVTNLVQDAVSVQGGQVHIALVANTGSETRYAAIATRNQTLKPPPVLSVSFCGDGSKQPSEQCDDGDTQNGDGCSSTCEFELPDGCVIADASDYAAAYAGDPYYEWVMGLAQDLQFVMPAEVLRCTIDSAALNDAFVAVLSNTQTSQFAFMMSRPDYPGPLGSMFMVANTPELQEWRFAGGGVRIDASNPAAAQFTPLDRDGLPITGSGGGGAAASYTQPRTCNEQQDDLEDCLWRVISSHPGCAFGLGCYATSATAAVTNKILAAIIAYGCAFTSNIWGPDCGPLWDAIKTKCPMVGPLGKPCLTDDCDLGHCIGGFSDYVFCIQDPGMPIPGCRSCEQCDGAGKCVSTCTQTCEVCTDDGCQHMKALTNQTPARAVVLNAGKSSFDAGNSCGEQPGCTMHADLTLQWLTCGNKTIDPFGTQGMCESEINLPLWVCGQSAHVGSCEELLGFLNVSADVQACGNANGWPFPDTFYDDINRNIQTPPFPVGQQWRLIDDDTWEMCECVP